MFSLEVGLERIKSLAKRMIENNLPDDDRAIVYAPIQIIINELDRANNDNNNANAYAAEKIGEIQWHSQAVAHLVTIDGHSDEQHFLWILRAIGAVKTDLALGKLMFQTPEQ